MGLILKTFTSSIGRKIVMALTGMFLLVFLIIHVGINACIFFNDGGKTFNAAADFMSHNFLIRVMEIGLFAGIIIHILQAIVLTMQNKRARSVKYEVVDANVNSKWYSRSMGLLGTLILLYLIMHLYHFWVPTKAAVMNHEDHNTYESLKLVFSNGIVVILYIIGVVALFFHLLHGFSSAFQTLGWAHRKWTPIVKQLGILYSVIICTLFALMPIAMYFKWIQ